MGGQIAAPDSLHLDMRDMNRLIAFDPERGTVRVQAGISWRDLQETLDRHGFSVAIMQSFSNFTVGGSVSVNCHGRYVGQGPIVNSVRALQLVTADGSVLELTPDSDVFRGVFGGYGGLGVVTEVELALARNTRLRRVVDRVDLASYPTTFLTKIEPDAQVVLHNADLRPPDFDEPAMITWRTTDKPVTVPERLIPKDRNYARNQAVIWAVSEMPGGAWLSKNVEQRLQAREMVVWRNYEASLDTDSLEPTTRRFSTYLLQEYFIPVDNFLGFARAMARILKRRRVNALNVSIRHSPRDPLSLLAWAPSDVFLLCALLQGAQQRTRQATRRCVDPGVDRRRTRERRTVLPALPPARDAVSIRKGISRGSGVRPTEGAPRSRRQVPQPALGHVPRLGGCRICHGSGISDSVLGRWGLGPDAELARRFVALAPQNPPPYRATPFAPAHAAL